MLVNAKREGKTIEAFSVLIATDILRDVMRHVQKKSKKIQQELDSDDANVDATKSG